MKNEIEYTMKYIEEISLNLGDKIYDYYIEEMSCPHNYPNRLPDGYSAIYIFIYKKDSEYEFLKIGKANENSTVRFQYQHYGFNAKSTLAKSICNDEEFIKLGINEDNVAEWIKNNLIRINIYIKSNRAATELVEAVLHYKFRPRYEENI